MSDEIQSSGSPENRKGKIHARVLSAGGGGPPVVILHGLLGSSRNWLTAGAALGGDRPVYAVDLPDHGGSAWSDEPSFAGMAGRVAAWAEGEGLAGADWIGHSLGGKVALRIASDRPGFVRRLVLVDIFPKVYTPHHAGDLEAMAALGPDDLADRRTADRALAAEVPDWALRQFILTNLVRSPDGGFRWQVNLKGLRRNLPGLAGLPYEGRPPVRTPALLVYGGRSGFVRREDLDRLDSWFADARAECIPESGHNPHIEAREEFVRTVRGFLGS
ncbi:MAG: alpha/beta fold hydrolase [Puniceicoccaceae bacterium]